MDEEKKKLLRTKHAKKEVYKVTEAEVEQRMQIIMEWLSSGYTKQTIIRYCADRFNINTRWSEELIKRATQRMVDAFEEPTKEFAAKIANSYWRIHRKAEKKEELNTSVSALRELSKLKGLDQILVNHVIHETKDIEEITDDMLEAHFTKVEEDDE